MFYKNVPLDPFQEDAIQAVNRDESVLVAAPTGAGKTLIAEYAIEKCINEGRRAVYTAPIKALSNQKFRDFTAQYGDRIGIKTGDVTLNADAQVVLMTTEIFRNTIFESPRNLDGVSYAVFDEIHYLDDIERGTVWEESIIFAPEHIRFLCLSATIPNLEPLAKWIRSVRPAVPLHVVLEKNRPVPLQHHLYVPALGLRKITELEELERNGDARDYFRAGRNEDVWRSKLIDHLFEHERLPAIYFAFNRRDCEEYAHALHRDLVTPEERTRLLTHFDELCARFAIEPEPTVVQLRSLVGRGAAYHHAGLLPTLKEVLERLFTTGLLKLLFATETFAVGVNMPARTVVFNTLFKFDGRSLALLRTREHHQMSGRAGRRGIDPVGHIYSVAEWPHIRTKSIERVLWGEIEPIRSQFDLSYATILTLYERLGDRIFEACTKSFANFAGGKERRSKATELVRDQLRRKIQLLRALGYLQGAKLTPRGRFARKIYGYELQVTELYFHGILPRLSDDEINILFCAIVYESKKHEWSRPLDKNRYQGFLKSSQRCINEILRAEASLGIEDRTKELDFKLGSAVLAWSRGAEFRNLEAHTGAADGDLVRYLRMSIQLLRNTAYSCEPADPLRPKLRRAVERICRDVVDAERQLRMGTDTPLAATPETPPGEGPETPPENKIL